MLLGNRAERRLNSIQRSYDSLALLPGWTLTGIHSNMLHAHCNTAHIQINGLPKHTLTDTHSTANVYCIYR